MTDQPARCPVSPVIAKFARHHALSERESQVLAHAAEGRSAKEIADSLHCSQSTVQTYWVRIVRKTRCACRAQVMAGLLKLATNE